jgi:hypothetical protein
MTIDYDIKKHQKIVKKYGTMKINNGFTVGEVKITRCKLKLSVMNPNIIKGCEVDVIYKGTIDKFGKCMGPRQEITDNKWFSKWGSTVRRNRGFRTAMSKHVLSYLRFLGVDIQYSFNFNIKKITWNE